MNKEYKSSLFYSDELREKIEYLIPSYPAADKLSNTFFDIGTQIEHLIKDWSEKKVSNIMSHINIAEISDHKARFLLTVTLSGSAPWSEERINAYHEDVKAKKEAKEKIPETKEELEYLEKLVNQYPDLTAKLLSNIKE